MGALFRSEKMTLAQLFLQSDSAYACVRELGELGMVQFQDLNPDVSAFQRKFVNEVKRCDEMERRLRFLMNELEKSEIEPVPGGAVEAPDPSELIDLESRLELLETEVKEINTNQETLKRNMLDLIELEHILIKTQGFFEQAELMTLQTQGAGMTAATGGYGSGLLDVEEGKGDAAKGGGAQATKLTFVAGVIRLERLHRFEQVLWRACHGNVFMRHTPIDIYLEDPTTGELVQKHVFVLFFQGEQLRVRVRKICEGFRATLYQCPESAAERNEMVESVVNRINDLETVLQQTKDHSRCQLQEIAQDIDTWNTKIKKVKAIYHTMNMFNLDYTQRCLVGECWCPVDSLDDIQAALTRGKERSGSAVPSILNRMQTKEAPPTYFKTNKFTSGFQAIVDAYGVASYEEVNPTPYTIITFPFLFAVMFGDAGHGLIMMLTAVFLIVREKQLKNFKGLGEMFETIFNGRYIVFFMGLFSIYTGLLYNDIFSKSLNIFGSQWDFSFNTTINDTDVVAFVPKHEGSDPVTNLPVEAMQKHNPYPFGIDPIWQLAENKLVFSNTLKMKMSVILGVGHMVFGVLLSIFNHIHFKKYINIFAEFIPQLIFILSLFGYLVFIVIFKWCTVYDHDNIHRAPNLLLTMINMMLKFGGSPDPAEEDYGLYSVDDEGNSDFQKILQSLLVVLAVMCVPWMLFMKPVYLILQHRRKKQPKVTVKAYRRINTESDDDHSRLISADSSTADEEEMDDKASVEDKDEEPFETGEIFVKQAIHTIEYCLGCISNTASYLRLWALSLAHAELSEVLWEMVLKIGLNVGSPAIGVMFMFVVFFFWACFTIAILLVMEGLSAFLHALRLHWVEFQSKFYSGEGYKFVPFSFETILSGEEEI
ncbi:V-type proton ATPase 116 kDa subunit a 1-like isoform X2 [Dysidea avara]|uniref:V-type proton ATPase 116 kDa subunit a 1-like isoform X2 n=1 Tax=Dysidea avara TaxID=196820 RepID=UPI003319BDC7